MSRCPSRRYSAVALSLFLLGALGSYGQECPSKPAQCDAATVIEECAGRVELEACFAMSAGADGIVDVGEAVWFCDRSGPEAPDFWCWTFGDGPGSGCESQCPYVRHTYERNGPFAVSLSVRKDKGISALISEEASAGITVECGVQAGREQVVVGTAGGRVAVPVAAVDGCHWSLSPDGAGFRIASPTAAELVGGQELEVEIEAGGEGELGEIRMIGPGVRSSDVGVRRVDVADPARRSELELPNEDTPEAPFEATYLCYDAEGARSCVEGEPIAGVVLGDGPGVAVEAAVGDGRLGLIREVIDGETWVLFDPREVFRRRGTGRMSCPVQSGVIDPGEVATASGLRSAFRTQSRDCRERREAKDDLELAEQSLNALVEDLERLRARLGVEEWALWGEGFGGQLALAYLRRYGRRANAAILHAAKSPERMAVDPRAAQAVVSEVGRRLRIDLDPLVQRLERALLKKKVEVNLVQPRLEGGRRILETRSTPLGVVDLRQAIAWWLLDRERLRRLPACLDLLAAGDFTPIGGAINEQTVLPCDFKDRSQILQQRNVAVRGECIGSALTFAAVCSARGDDDSAVNLRELARDTTLWRAFDFPFPEICRQKGWDVEAQELEDCLGGDCGEALDSLPILLIHAELDPIAPPTELERVEEWISRKVRRETALRRLVLGNGARSDLFDPRLKAEIMQFLGQNSVQSRVELPSPFGGPALPCNVEPAAGSSRFRLTVRRRGRSGAVLKWDAPRLPLGAYGVEYRRGDSGWRLVTVVPPGRQRIILRRLEPSETYFFRVGARRHGGGVGRSNAVRWPPVSR